MHLIGMAIVGFLAGLVARFFYPGAIHMGFIGTMLLGIAGSYVAGYIGSALHGRGQAGFQRTGFLYSVLGALLLIWIGLRLGLV